MIGANYMSSGYINKLVGGKSNKCMVVLIKNSLTGR
jgi:hypothetical protein